MCLGGANNYDVVAHRVEKETALPYEASGIILEPNHDRNVSIGQQVGVARAFRQDDQGLREAIRLKHEERARIKILFFAEIRAWENKRLDRLRHVQPVNEERSEGESDQIEQTAVAEKPQQDPGQDKTPEQAEEGSKVKEKEDQQEGTDDLVPVKIDADDA